MLRIYDYGVDSLGSNIFFAAGRAIYITSLKTSEVLPQELDAENVVWNIRLGWSDPKLEQPSQSLEGSYHENSWPSGHERHRNLETTFAYRERERQGFTARSSTKCIESHC
eukprot:862760-Amphidinium_carterae.1